MTKVEAKQYLDFINMRLRYDKKILRRLLENEKKFWKYGYGDTFSFLSSLLEESDAN
jgi:predicted metal-binding protein